MCAIHIFNAIPFLLNVYNETERAMQCRGRIYIGYLHGDYLSLVGGTRYRFRSLRDLLGGRCRIAIVVYRIGSQLLHIHMDVLH